MSKFKKVVWTLETKEYYGQSESIFNSSLDEFLEELGKKDIPCKVKVSLKKNRQTAIVIYSEKIKEDEK